MKKRTGWPGRSPASSKNLVEERKGMMMGVKEDDDAAC